MCSSWSGGSWTCVFGVDSLRNLVVLTIAVGTKYTPYEEDTRYQYGFLGFVLGFRILEVHAAWILGFLPCRDVGFMSCNVQVGGQPSIERQPCWNIEVIWMKQANFYRPRCYMATIFVFSYRTDRLMGCSTRIDESGCINLWFPQGRDLLEFAPNSNNKYMLGYTGYCGWKPYHSKS